TSPKSGKRREVRVKDDLLKALAGHINGRGNPWKEEPLFPGPDGGYMDGSALRRRFIAACDRADLRRTRFHDLRHAALSHWGDAGMDPWKLQKMAGHASIKTSQRYIHLADDD